LFVCLGRPTPAKHPTRWYVEMVSPVDGLPTMRAAHKPIMRERIREELAAVTGLEVKAVTTLHMALK
jgi:hypothetical protein